MSLETVVLVARYANVALGAVAFLWFLLKLSDNWRFYPTPFRAYSMALLFYAFAAVYSSAESIAQRDPPGYRAAFVMVANLSLLAALWMMRGRHTEATPR